MVRTAQTNCLLSAVFLVLIKLERVLAFRGLPRAVVLCGLFKAHLSSASVYWQERSIIALRAPEGYL